MAQETVSFWDKAFADLVTATSDRTADDLVSELMHTLRESPEHVDPGNVLCYEVAARALCSTPFRWTGTDHPRRRDIPGELRRYVAPFECLRDVWDTIPVSRTVSYGGTADYLDDLDIPGDDGKLWRGETPDGRLFIVNTHTGDVVLQRYPAGQYQCGGVSISHVYAVCAVGRHGTLSVKDVEELLHVETPSGASTETMPQSPVVARTPLSLI